MVSRRKVLQLVSGASAAALAGCFGGGSSPEDDGGGDGDGDGDGDGGGGTQTQAGLERTTRAFGVIGTSTAAQKYSDYSWNQLEDADPVVTDTITITRDYKFEPMIIRVPPGTTVTWESESLASETVTIPKLGVDEQLMAESFEYTFEEPGVYNYLCKRHPSDHLGRVVVDETLTAVPGDDGTDTDDEMDGDTPTDES